VLRNAEPLQVLYASQSPVFGFNFGDRRLDKPVHSAGRFVGTAQK
jgi:hypothetical protein